MSLPSRRSFGQAVALNTAARSKRSRKAKPTDPRLSSAFEVMDAISHSICRDIRYGEAEPIPGIG